MGSRRLGNLTALVSLPSRERRRQRRRRAPLPSRRGAVLARCCGRNCAAGARALCRLTSRCGIFDADGSIGTTTPSVLARERESRRGAGGRPAGGGARRWSALLPRPAEPEQAGYWVGRPCGLTDRRVHRPRASHAGPGVAGIPELRRCPHVLSAWPHGCRLLRRVGSCGWRLSSLPPRWLWPLAPKARVLTCAQLVRCT